MTAATLVKIISNGTSITLSVPEAITLRDFLNREFPKKVKQ